MMRNMPPVGAEGREGCGKKGCTAAGWTVATNEVPYGDTYVAESWEGYCPDHGWYGQQGSGGVVWFDELEPPEMSDERKAAYYGFPNVKTFRRALGLE